jgi:hypothetical protein
MDNSVSHHRIQQLRTWNLPETSQPFEKRREIANARRSAASELQQMCSFVEGEMQRGALTLDPNWREAARVASELPWNDEQRSVAAPVLQLLAHDPDLVSDSQKKAFLSMVGQLPTYPQV